MNNRLLSIILIIISFIIIIGIVYFIFFLNFKQDLAIITNDNNNQGQLSPLSNADPESLNTLGETKIIKELVPIKKENSVPASATEIQSTELQKIASSFAERWGSYSNHSDFSNLKDLKIFMTDGMAEWADTLMKEGREGLGDTSIYQGVTTKAISSKIKSFSQEDKKAVIIVTTQRTTKSGDSSETSTTYEDILITFVKEGNDWKVGRVD